MHNATYQVCCQSMILEWGYKSVETKKKKKKKKKKKNTQINTNEKNEQKTEAG